MNFGNTQPVASSSYGPVDVPINKATTIHELLNGQATAIAESYAVLEQLAVRLESVLRPLPPAPSATSNQTPQPMQISARIAEHTDGVQALTNRMHSLLERLEV